MDGGFAGGGVVMIEISGTFYLTLHAEASRSFVIHLPSFMYNVIWPVKIYLNIHIFHCQT